MFTENGKKSNLAVEAPHRRSFRDTLRRLRVSDRTIVTHTKTYLDPVIIQTESALLEQAEVRFCRAFG